MAQQTLFTFGYLSSRAERIITELIALKIPVVDVRFSPVSRNWRYTQAAMQRRDGILYHHIVELGNELYKEALSASHTEPHIKLHAPETGLARLGAILDEHGRAAIFCACSNKTKCHRIAVAQLAQEQLHVKVVHL